MRPIFFFLAVLIASSTEAQRAVVISSIPTNTPPGAVIHLASSANGWNPGDPGWIFSSWNTQWIFDVPASAPNVFQGKMTMGSWQSVEGNASGEFLPDRTFDFTSTDTLVVQIQSWEGLGGGVELPPNVVILDDAFFMPQLDRTRRIRLFLPTNYDSTTLDYPVLYMHDGQNLFSAAEAFAGEWEVDEAMLAFEADGYNGAIVVAIDNGGAQRIAEYTPWANDQYGGGDGALYTDFIVETLKPFVDENYRTLSDRENTGIMGSSLGGLISFYAAVRHQDVFSKAGVFSPSFWFTNDIYDFMQTTGKEADMLFFFLAGEQESATLVSDINEMTALMQSEGFTESEIRFDTHADGQHSEWFWAREFPDAFEWLYMSTTTDLSVASNSEKLKIQPNPVTDTMWFILPEGQSITDVLIFDVSGRLCFEKQQSGPRLELGHLPKGIYQLRLTTLSGTYTENFVKL